MSEFTFDTSGVVLVDRHGEPPMRAGYRWSDLTPFAQGYVKGPLREASGTCARCQGNGEIVTDLDLYLHPPEGAEPDAGTADCPDCDGQGERTFGFSDLSPEALAMILGDCERFAELFGERPEVAHGKHFWIGRQKDKHPDFPPLTPYLSDDGKVCLKPSGSDQ